MSGDSDTAEERATFVVRLWRRGPVGPWRGQVEYVQLGEQSAAPDVAGVFRQLTEWISLTAARREQEDRG